MAPIPKIHKRSKSTGGSDVHNGKGPKKSGINSSFSNASPIKKGKQHGRAQINPSLLKQVGNGGLRSPAWTPSTKKGSFKAEGNKPPKGQMTPKSKQSPKGPTPKQSPNTPGKEGGGGGFKQSPMTPGKKGGGGFSAQGNKGPKGQMSPKFKQSPKGPTPKQSPTTQKKGVFNAGGNKAPKGQMSPKLKQSPKQAPHGQAPASGNLSKSAKRRQRKAMKKGQPPAITPEKNSIPLNKKLKKQADRTLQMKVENKQEGNSEDSDEGGVEDSDINEEEVEGSDVDSAELEDSDVIEEGVEDSDIDEEEEEEDSDIEMGDSDEDVEGEEDVDTDEGVEGSDVDMDDSDNEIDVGKGNEAESSDVDSAELEDSDVDNAELEDSDVESEEEEVEGEEDDIGEEMEGSDVENDSREEEENIEEEKPKQKKPKEKQDKKKESAFQFVLRMLPVDITDKDIREHFSNVQSINTLKIVRGAKPKNTVAYMFLKTDESAEVLTYHNTLLKGCVIKVSKKDKQENKVKVEESNKEPRRRDPSLSVFVRNIPFMISQAELRDHFSTVCRVKDAIIPQENGRSRGFGFVELEDEASYEEALKLNKSSLLNRNIMVLPHKRSSEKPPVQQVSVESSEHSTTVIVKGLPSSIKKSDLRQCFWAAGMIQDIKLLPVPGTETVISTVTMKDDESYQNALLRDKSQIGSDHISVIPYAAEELPTSEMKPSTKKRYVLFVGNLPYTVQEETLKEHFKNVGNIINLRIPMNKDSKKARGIAFLEVANQEAWEKSLSLNNTMLGGRRIHVECQGKNKGNPKERVKKNFKLHALVKAGKFQTARPLSKKKQKKAD